MTEMLPSQTGDFRQSGSEYETTTANDTTPSYLPEPARDQVVRPQETQPSTQPIYNGDYVETQPTVMPEPVPQAPGQTASLPTTETSGGNMW